MKKIIILSIAAIAVLFLSLAINVNNNSGSIDLKSPLQTAKAANVLVNWPKSGNFMWIDMTLNANAKIWGSMCYNWGADIIDWDNNDWYGYHKIGELNQLVYYCTVGGSSTCTSDYINADM